MEIIQRKAPIISLSTYVLILLFCLLPFVSVGNSDQKIAEATGVELLVDKEKRKTSPFMALVVLSSFAGIVFTLRFKNDEQKFKISIISSAAVIALSLILMRLYIGSDGITVNYEIGYWLCLLLPVVLVVFIFYIYSKL